MQGATDEPGSLARIAGRGKLRRCWHRRNADVALRPWQRGLLGALGLSDGEYSSAPLCALGSGLDASGVWMHAEPVHLVAGLDRLTFVDLQRHAPLSVEERSALAQVLGAQFPHAQFTWHATAQSWLIRSERALEVLTSTPEAAAVHELAEVLPRGKDASELRRLMTEMQMALHDHPVNTARERNGLPTANAIWLWGLGSLAEESPPAQNLPQGWSDDDFTRGVYRLHGADLEPLAPVTSMMSHSRIARLAVAPVVEVEELQREWIDPLIHALASREIDGLELVLDQWRLQADRSALRRFWRKPLAPSGWDQRT